MKRLVLLLLLAGCGGEDFFLHTACHVPACDYPLEVTTAWGARNVYLVTASANEEHCSQSAVFQVGEEITQRLYPGESDLGITLLRVRYPEPRPEYRVDICVE